MSCLVTEMTDDPDQEEEEEEAIDWADEVSKEEEKEQTASKSRKMFKGSIKDIVVASVSDDGTLRLWRPVEVIE